MDGTIMEVTLKITRSHGRTIPEPNVKVGPVNNVLSSLFESLEMRINDKQTESGRYYPVQVVILKIVAFILKQYAEDGKSTYELIIALKDLKGTVCKIHLTQQFVWEPWNAYQWQTNNRIWYRWWSPKKIQSGNCNQSKKLQSENLARNAWPHPKFFQIPVTLDSSSFEPGVVQTGQKSKTS